MRQQYLHKYVSTKYIYINTFVKIGFYIVWRGGCKCWCGQQESKECPAGYKVRVTVCNNVCCARTFSVKKEDAGRSFAFASSEKRG